MTPSFLTPIDESLLWAARRESEAAVVAALEAGASVHATDRYGETPLHRAAASNSDPNVVDVLLSVGADLERTARMSGRTPLLNAAAENGNPYVLRTLLNAGAKRDAQDREGATALVLALGNPSPVTTTRMLLAAGIDPNVRDKEGSIALLHALWRSRRPAIIEPLLEATTDVTARDQEGCTALAALARIGHLDGVARMLDLGADPEDRDRYGTTPLLEACGASPEPAVVQLLLDAGAEPDRFGRWMTPLMATCRCPVRSDEADAAVARMLLEAGASVDARSRRGRTALHAAALWADGPEVVKALLEAGADVDARCVEGLTPLVFAIEGNPHPEVTVELLRAGARLDLAPDGERTSLLLRAARAGAPGGVLAALIEAGQDVHQRDEVGATVLGYAAERAEDPSVVDVLTRAGAEVNATGFDGTTPLHLAAAENGPEMVRALLAAGADPEPRDGSGARPLDYALARTDEREVVDALIGL